MDKVLIFSEREARAFSKLDSPLFPFTEEDVERAITSKDDIIGKSGHTTYLVQRNLHV